MKRRKLKKVFAYAIYAMSFIVVMGAIYLFDSAAIGDVTGKTLYVKDMILNNIFPVSQTKELVVKPYLDTSVKVVRNFYDSKDASDVQENSLIYYQGTYLPNSGIDYKGDKAFDVVAVLDGKVTKVTDNSLLGKTVEITHANNLITIYQSLGDIIVREGDAVVQGQAIAKSGDANISTELGNHLHFEMVLNGVNLNPNKCFGISIDKLQEL